MLKKPPPSAPGTFSIGPSSDKDLSPGDRRFFPLPLSAKLAVFPATNFLFGYKTPFLSEGPFSPPGHTRKHPPLTREPLLREPRSAWIRGKNHLLLRGIVEDVLFQYFDVRPFEV